MITPDAHPLPVDLPEPLAERAIALNDRPVREDGEFVLCWLHHAIRDHENPALDAAITVANRANKPVLVYQGLGGDHRFNSDRHHRFILEGARDLARGLRERGIAFAFHLPTDPTLRTGGPSPIRGLIARAAAVVTEDFPAPPFPEWSAAHAARAPGAFVAIDSACVMPLRLLGKRHDRAFAFRDSAKKHWRSRLGEAWHEVTPEHEPPNLDDLDLGFELVDLERADLDDLCARCLIDHAVPPVGRAAGGSDAGYARWEAFKREHLGRYDKRRNDATAMEAVSCLSPYLHHGHVSPFRIAREADATGGPGAEKFLDELLVWRELAHNFCAHTESRTLESLGVLPEWAQKTLGEHADDPREAVYTWEALARARTGDELWDWAQKSLLRNGELHNNLRMTWGKMIPRWKASPEQALRDLIDLNHRFALDGNNPNSYGGLLWCLGRFDRPFTPEQPVLGTVRDRTTAVHAERLDVGRYGASVRVRAGYGPLRVAVVGGGVSGLACARTLADQGCAVRVFDKGRAVGGRMSTRPADAGGFDHGAPAFGVTDERFARFVRSWIESGVCAVWRPRVAVLGGDSVRPIDDARPLAVGTPGMSAVCAHLAADLPIETSTSVTAIERQGDAWTLLVEPWGAEATRERGFDAVVVATAATQAARLLDEHSPEIRGVLATIESRCQWVLMGETEIPDDAGLPDVLLCEGDPAIEKIVREGSKPGRAGASRPGFERLVVHAAADWSRVRRDTDRETVGAELARETSRVLATLGIRGGLSGARAHRWGLGRAAALSGHQCAFDRVRNLASCGDGFSAAVGDAQSRLEDGVQNAFLSGIAAAGRVLSLRARRAAGAEAQASLF